MFGGRGVHFAKWIYGYSHVQNVGKDKFPHFPLSSQATWHYCNLSAGQVPGILPQLQKSVQAILLGRAQLPDWFNSGVRAQSHTTGFPLPPVAGQLVHFEGIQGSHCPLWPVSLYILKIYRVPTALCGRSFGTFWKYTGFPLPSVAGQLVHFEGIQGSHWPLWQVGWYNLKLHGVPTALCGWSVGTFWRDSHCPLWQVSWYILKVYRVPTGPCGRSVGTIWSYGVPTALCGWSVGTFWFPLAGHLVHFEGIQGSHCPLWPVSWYILKVYRVPTAPCGCQLVHFEGIPTALWGRSLGTVWGKWGSHCHIHPQLVKEEWIQGFHWFLW